MERSGDSDADLARALKESRVLKVDRWREILSPKKKKKKKRVTKKSTEKQLQRRKKQIAKTTTMTV